MEDSKTLEDKFFRVYVRNGQDHFNLMHGIFSTRPPITSAKRYAEGHFKGVSELAIIGIQSWDTKLEPEISSEKLATLHVVARKEFSELET